MAIYQNGHNVTVGGKVGVLTYSHMAMIELLPDGRLVAAWQGSHTIEGATDQRIYLAYSEDEEGLRCVTSGRLLGRKKLKT